MSKNSKNTAFKSSINEKELFECLTYEEIFHLIVTFQAEKRKYFIKYLNCIDKLSESEKKGTHPELERQRDKILDLHLHYEDLVQWCFQETTKRTKKKKS